MVSALISWDVLIPTAVSSDRSGSPCLARRLTSFTSSRLLQRKLRGGLSDLLTTL